MTRGGKRAALVAALGVVVCVTIWTVQWIAASRTIDLATTFADSSEVVIRDSAEAAGRTITDRPTITALVNWAGKRAGWREHPLGTAPSCAIVLEFRDARHQLIGGVGVGERTLWQYPSVSATTALPVGDREQLFLLLGVQSPFAVGPR
jgi:hypothetical protein